MTIVDDYKDTSKGKDDKLELLSQYFSAKRSMKNKL